MSDTVPLRPDRVTEPAPGRPAPHLRTAGWFSIASGVMFLLSVGYLFTVLTGTGLTFAMFDDATTLLPWIDQHLSLYQGLYVLYALSQLLLLPVPALLWRVAVAMPGGDPQDAQRVWWLIGAIAGVGAALLAIVGLAVSYGLAAPSAASYVAAPDDDARWAVLVTHAVTADIAKNVRLFSEVLLGVWLLVTGWLYARGRPARGVLVGPMLGVVGGWTVLVAGWKLVDPVMPLEDWLAFVVAAAQIALGVVLLRRRAVQAER